ncbi:SEC10/PgrA surface exclusion domain-containing protein [Streptococcus suis]|nr:SEC10/PgrA surface exclusion domain-containing protein [Streptococcus suis]NQK57568.1 SEC10/PgrA surface exclusion domain-containing protein [Streptococcus suis]
MNKKSIKTLATGAAITIATVGTPTFAEEVTPTVETNTDTVVSTTETPVAETPKTSADVKPALDAQQAVVDATAAEANQAQADADAANQAVTTAEAEVATATEAVKDAEENLANATPENIAANQADQTANLADQTANATETDEVNAEITSQTQTVADAQVAVDTAQAEKDQADSAVTAAEADVKAAQDALSGTGLAEAQTNLDTASKAVTDAKANVDTATQAVEDAKKADAKRQEAIDAATTDVAVKTDAVDTASSRVTAAQNNVASTTEALAKANDAVTKAQDAMKDIEFVKFPEAESKAYYQALLDNYKLNQGSKFDISNPNQTQEQINAIVKVQNIGMSIKGIMFNSHKNVINPNYVEGSVQFKESDKSRKIDILNLTDDEILELMQFNLLIINAQRTATGLEPLTLTTGTVDTVKKNVQRNIDANKGYGHLNTDFIAESKGYMGDSSDFKTMYDVKQTLYSMYIETMHADYPSNYAHAFAPLRYDDSMKVGLGIYPYTASDGSKGMFMIENYDTYPGDPIPNPNDPTALQATLEKAKADQAAAQAALTNAKTQLTKASADYATALEAKTAAEKTLADATATPLQTQVAENNLRLATIALQNAETRKTEAQKAVDNFSGSLSEKKAALDTAKASLATAQATATAKAEALTTAQANLATQQATLDSLNKERDALIAEKDRLVEEAKALAEELDGYMNAPARLEKTKATLTEKQAALTEAQAKAETAQNKLETVTAKLAEEKAKLAEFQAEYDKLKDLENKAKDNVIATLPDGTIVAVPKDAPTAVEKPGVEGDAVKQALDKGQDVTVVDGEVVVTKPQAGVTVTQTTTGEKVTDSRVERAKILPNTGEQTSLALALLGLTNLLGVAVLRRNK